MAGDLSGAGFRADTRPPIPKGFVMADEARGETCGRCGRFWCGTVVVRPDNLVLARWRSFCATYPHEDDRARAM